MPGAAELCEQRLLLSAVYPSIDGRGNNPENPDWGRTDIELLRLTGYAYEDGISDPSGYTRVSAREVSNAVVDQPGSIINDRNLTDFIWVWGQFIDHDIDLTEGADPAEPFDIQVPKGDRHFDPASTGTAVLGFSRSQYVQGSDSSDGARQQLNQITAFLDGSVVYGSDDVRAAALRTHADGKMKTSAGDLLPFNTPQLPNAGGNSNRLFLAGDIRANENVVLSSMHTVFIREHNRIADEYAAANPTAGDEEIYQYARSVVAAEIQAITFNEFLPALLGPDAPGQYSEYDPYVNPGIANEFSTAAYRFGHSLISSTLQRLDANGDVIPEGNLSLASGFFRPDTLIATGVDPLLRGVAVQQSQEVDAYVVDELRNFLFGPPGAGGLDLPSLNIQRGRDHGLQGYNQTRIDLGLHPVSSFDEITSDPVIAAALQDTYGTVDDIDLWIGGLAEDHRPGSSMGETFTTIVADQFWRIRAGDRFWYQNRFDGPQLADIENTRLSDVIERNTGITGLQTNVFFSSGTEIVEFYVTSDVVVRKVGSQIHVVDQHSNQILLCRELSDIGGLALNAEHEASQSIEVEGGLTADDLPFGITLHGGYEGPDVLTVHGTNAADTIVVDHNEIQVNDLDVFYEEFETLIVDAEGGSDYVRVDSTSAIHLIVHGGAGHDTLIGSAGQDRLFGDSGDDLLIGKNGDDVLFGGRGRDRLFGGGGTNVLHGGAGVDFVLDAHECETEAEYDLLAAQLDTLMDFRSTGNYFENWGGRSERWFRGSGAWYFITPDGTVYRWDGSRNAGGYAVANLSVRFYHDPLLLCGASVHNEDSDSASSLRAAARTLGQVFRLRTTGNFYENWGGRGERWLWSHMGWCFITDDGNLYHWDRSGGTASGTLIAELTPEYFHDPLKLLG